MSLELALQENTSALHTLIALLEKGGVPVAPAAEVKASLTKAAVSKTVSEAVPEKPAYPQAVVETTQVVIAEPVAETISEDVKAVTYEDAKAAVTNVVKAKGRDAGLAVLAKFGAESLLAVPADQWTAVISACGEALK